jgi:hypothetical protein
MQLRAWLIGCHYRMVPSCQLSASDCNKFRDCLNTNENVGGWNLICRKH